MKTLVLQIAAFGRLRLSLFALTILAILFAPEPEVRAITEWPLIVPTLIAPTVAPLVLMAVLLDLVMAKVMSAGEEDAAKQAHARQVMLADALAAIAVAYAYLPFFLALGR